MSERVSGYGLGDIARNIAPDIAPCVYAVYFRSELRYIGKTKVSLIGRICQHIRDENSKVGRQIREHIGFCRVEGWFGTPNWDVLKPDGIDDWYIAFMPTELADLDAAEQYNIRRFDPPLNVQYRNNADIRRTKARAG